MLVPAPSRSTRSTRASGIWNVRPRRTCTTQVFGPRFLVLLGTKLNPDGHGTNIATKSKKKTRREICHLQICGTPRNGGDTSVTVVTSKNEQRTTGTQFVAGRNLKGTQFVKFVIAEGEICNEAFLVQLGFQFF